MAGLIHINTARQILLSGQTVSLKFRKEDGETVSADSVICTSSYHHANTFNLKFLTSNLFRKVMAVTIFEINDIEIFI